MNLPHLSQARRRSGPCAVRFCGRRDPPARRGTLCREHAGALPVLVLVLGLALVPSGLIALAYRSYTSVGGESSTLRSDVLSATGVEWSPSVEAGVGGGLLGLARCGSALLDLPPEARAVLRAVREAEVGIYQASKRSPDRITLLESTDRNMSERGWERVVGVLDGEEMVAVYLPVDLRSGRDLRLCVLVLDAEQLVVVAARANLEPLLKLAEAHSEEWLSSGHHGIRL